MTNTASHDIYLSLNGANLLREVGYLDESLAVSLMVRAESEKQSNWHSYVHSFLCDQLTFRLKNDLDSAKVSAENAWKSAQEHQLSSEYHYCTDALGMSALVSKDYPAAISWFNKTLNEYYPTQDAARARYLNHLGKAQCESGDLATGVKTLQTALEQIDKYDERSISRDHSLRWRTWKCDVLLALAKYESSKKDNYLKQANEIALQEPVLYHIKKQLEELTANK